MGLLIAHNHAVRILDQLFVIGLAWGVNRASEVDATVEMRGGAAAQGGQGRPALPWPVSPPASSRPTLVSRGFVLFRSWFSWASLRWIGLNSWYFLLTPCKTETQQNCGILSVTPYPTMILCWLSPFISSKHDKILAVNDRQQAPPSLPFASP